MKWLVEIEQEFHGAIDFAHALLLFAEEAAMLGYSSDDVDVKWFPKGFYIVEQGEPATKLYLVLSGQAGQGSDKRWCGLPGCRSVASESHLRQTHRWLSAMCQTS